MVNLKVRITIGLAISIILISGVLLNGCELADNETVDLSKTPTINETPVTLSNTSTPYFNPSQGVSLYASTPTPITGIEIDETNAFHLKKVAQWGKGIINEIALLEGNQGFLQQLGFIPDFYLLIATSKGLYEGTPDGILRTFFNEERIISPVFPQKGGMIYSNSNTIYVASSLASRSYYESLSNTNLDEFTFDKIELSLDNRYLGVLRNHSSDEQDIFQIWDWSNQEAINLDGIFPADAESDFVFSPDGNTAVVSTEFFMNLIDTRRFNEFGGEIYGVLAETTDTSIQISPDNRYVITNALFDITGEEKQDQVDYFKSTPGRNHCSYLMNDVSLVMESLGKYDGSYADTGFGYLSIDCQGLVKISPDNNQWLVLSEENGVQLLTKEGNRIPLMVPFSDFIDFSADSTKIISVTNRGTVSVFGATDGVLITTFPTNIIEVNKTTISLDLSYIAIAGKEINNPSISIQVYQIDTGELKKEYTGYSYPITAITLKNNQLAYIEGSVLKIGDILTGNLLYDQETGNLKDTDIVYTTDNLSIGITDYANNRFENVELTNDENRSSFFENPCLDEEENAGGYFLVDHDLVVKQCGSELFLINQITGNIDKTIQIGDELITGSIIIPNGQALLTGDEEGEINYWNLTNGDLLRTMSCNGKISQLSTSSKNQVFAAVASIPSENQEKQTVCLWNLDSEGSEKTISFQTSASQPTPIITLSPNGDVIALSKDSSVELWGTGNGEILTTLSGHTDQITDLEFTQNGQYLISSSLDGTINFWSVVP